MAEYPKIQNICVDLDALRSIAHRCDPLRCRHVRACCARYEVCVDSDQAGGIVGMLPHAAQYAPALFEDGGYIDPFDDADDGELALATDEDGRCVFAYVGRHGETLCALHSAALDLSLPPHRAKPRSCWLWPLALSESTPPVLSVQDGAFALPCNRRRSGRGLHRGIEDIVRARFGAAFLEALYGLLRRRAG